jgi:hypothetical protein
VNLRETMRRNPRGTIVISIAAILVAGVFWRVASGTPGAAPEPALAFYSSDDGRTFFSAKVSDAQPLDAQGHVGVLAIVFNCDQNNSKFVGYLQRTRSDAPSRKDDAGIASPYDAAEKNGTALEVKRPGEKRWVYLFSREGAEIRRVNCPDGKGQASRVAP